MNSVASGGNVITFLALRDNNGVCHKLRTSQLIASAYRLYPLEKRGKIVSREQITRRRQHGGKLCDDHELLKKLLYFDNVKPFFLVSELFFISFIVIIDSIHGFSSLIVAVEAKLSSTFASFDTCIRVAENVVRWSFKLISDAQYDFLGI